MVQPHLNYKGDTCCEEASGVDVDAERFWILKQMLCLQFSLVTTYEFFCSSK